MQKKISWFKNLFRPKLSMGPTTKVAISLCLIPASFIQAKGLKNWFYNIKRPTIFFRQVLRKCSLSLDNIENKNIFIKLPVIIATKFALLIHKNKSVLASLRDIYRKIIYNENCLGKNNHELYNLYIQRYEANKPEDIEKIKLEITGWSLDPLISIVMPVYNTDIELLKKAINSIQKQIYTNFELCIADDNSSNIELKVLLKNYSKQDTRIKVVSRQENGHICAATNSALELCTGEFTAFMDHDDLIPNFALYYIAKEIIKNPKLNLIYSDSDHIDQLGERHTPFFKPDWNEELALAQNYINHLTVCRTSLIKELGGLRLGYEGSQDHDLVLRIAQKSTETQIKHIPRILYHWRSYKGSGSFSDNFLSQCEKARIKLAEDYILNKGLKAKVSKGFDGNNRISYDLPQELPLVSCIVAMKDRAQMTKDCLNGILHGTDYPKLEIILVDNGSTEKASKDLFEELKQENRVSVIHWNKDFNYSEINNMAANKAKGEYLALVNNDIKVIAENWLKEMLSYAIQNKAGAVGAKLLYEDSTIQHAGVILGGGGGVGHCFAKSIRDINAYYGNPQLAREINCVTGACLVVKKSKYFQVGGLNEEELKVAYNDVDFCIKLWQAGYKNFYTPYACLYHLESVSRGYDDSPQKKERQRNELNYLQKNWGELLQHDTQYNPNLSLKTLYDIIHEDEEIRLLD